MTDMSYIIKSLSNCIPQEDTLMCTLTPRETLRYTAELRLPEEMPRAAVYDRVEKIMTQLSLLKCADVTIGDVQNRGISGGQRKRVSIAMELLTNPSILFVDEPTSGLDSKTAADVVSIINDLGKQGRTILCIIHQPSYHVFLSFSKLLLLHKGGIAYEGTTGGTEQYFNDLGFHTPNHENPADYYMQVLQEEVPKDDDWVETWVKRSKKPIGGSRYHSLLDMQKVDTHAPQYLTSKYHQFKVLVRRSFYDYVKDPEKFGKIIVFKILVGIIVGLAWINQGRENSQAAIFPVSGAMFMLIFNSTIDTMFLMVMTYPPAKALLLREYNNGTYSLVSWFFAEMFTVVTFQSLFQCCMGIPVYFMIGLAQTTPQILTFFLVLTTLGLIGASLGMILGLIAKDVSEAQQYVMPTLVPLILFSGYVIPWTQIKDVYKPLYHISFFQYALSLLQKNQWEDATFDDCRPVIV